MTTENNLRACTLDGRAMKRRGFVRHTGINGRLFALVVLLKSSTTPPIQRDTDLAREIPVPVNLKILVAQALANLAGDPERIVFVNLGSEGFLCCHALRAGLHRESPTEALREGYLASRRSKLAPHSFPFLRRRDDKVTRR
jgi:hypothetical protein